MGQEHTEGSVGGNTFKDALRVLREGGVIVYPTDTLYGLGADATDIRAVETVRRIKGRDSQKPILALVSDEGMLAEYANLTPLANTLMRAFLPGPLTLILTARTGTLTPIAAPDGSVGFRMPRYDLCTRLAAAFGKPLTSTSVNRSGFSQPPLVRDMLSALAESAHLIGAVLDEGSLPGNTPSTIVDARGDKARVVREGVVSREEVASIVPLIS